MSKPKPTFIIALFVLVIVSAANLWQYVLKPAEAAPVVSFKAIDGKTIDLQKLQGKPVLISFWATSCGLCLSELDDLIKLHNQYQQQGYTTIAVSLSYDSLPAIKQMQQQRNLPYPLVYDKDGKYAEAFGGVQMTPTHFLIDSDGIIAARNVGAVHVERMQAWIEKNLNKQAKTDAEKNES